MSNNRRNPFENEIKNSVSYHVANEVVSNVGKAAAEIGQNLGRAAVVASKNIADSIERAQQMNNNGNTGGNYPPPPPVYYQDDVNRTVNSYNRNYPKGKNVPPPPPPVKMKNKAKETKGAARFWLAGALLLLYTAGFPFYSSLHLGIAIALGVAGYQAGKAYSRWNSKRKSAKIAEESRRRLAEMEQMQKDAEAAEKAKQEAAKRAETQVKSTGNPELDKIIAEGNDYIYKFRKANEAIPGEQISRDIDRIEKSCKGIFEYIADNPKKLNEIKKFMNYYLPTTLKLLNNYQRLQKQTVKGENIANSMFDIEGMMHTIAVAFEKQLDSLFDSDAMDIQAEIEVFENILTQEGLTEEGNIPQMKL